MSSLFVETASLPDPNLGDRSPSDRRRTPTSPWAAFRHGGRRVRQRRTDEHKQPYFVDRFSKRAGILSITLVTLSMVDAVATLVLLDAGCEEVNPAMSFLLEYGNQAFLLGKWGMTAAAIPVLLVCQHHYLFGTKLRVSYLLPILVGLYGLLNAYQLVLFFLL